MGEVAEGVVGAHAAAFADLIAESLNRHSLLLPRLNLLFELWLLHHITLFHRLSSKGVLFIA